ncbi:DUF5721 family protein [Butyrivibrio sp. FCS014]|uniref:DUF5721 family protein n=1 Tax=Butyrivibrio sp. FCS014 TaxID=1408304 RepID=UPI00046318EB|nr:DUF5721 family protein [Butyrivibrio sp. FCS014]
MIAIRIRGQKNFMAKLLTTDLFDRYLLEEATIETFNTFTIDGKINRDFYDGYEGLEDGENAADPGAAFSTWSMIRPICLDLIKGKRTPLSFKFVLFLDDNSKEELFRTKDIDMQPDQVSFGIIIKFSSGEVQITTGISHKTFTMDKTAEKAWDAYIPSFLDSNGIDYEIL